MKFDVNKIKKIAGMFILIFIAILVGSIFFLYRYFYQTLTQAQIVILLKSQVSSDVLNIKTWEKIVNNIDYKITPLVDVKNLPPSPFNNIE